MKLVFIWSLWSVIAVALPTHYASTDNVTIGDTITYAIELPEWAHDFSVQPTFNGLALVDQSINHRPTATVHEFRLQVVALNDVLIPTLSINTINGVAPTTLSPIFFYVRSVLSPTANALNDIAPLVGMFYINGLLVAIGLVVIGLGVILFLIWKKTPRHREVATQTISPKERATSDLQALSKRLTNDPQQIKQAYFDLTEILCRFLTDVTGLNVLDATTAEMQRMIQPSTVVSKKQVSTIIQACKAMDVVKFTQEPDLTLANIQSTVQVVRQIVDEVSP